MIDPDLKKYLDDLIRLQKAELGLRKAPYRPQQQTVSSENTSQDWV